MKYANNIKPVSERKQVLKSGRIRTHHSHSQEAFLALTEMARVTGVPTNFMLDVVILQAYKRWLEDRAIQKTLEGEIL